MILVDTSIWIDHLWGRATRLPELLEAEQVLGHPMVRGEVACGTMKQRELILGEMELLPQVKEARHHEVTHLIETHALHGRDLGFIDLHLLASARLSHANLLTRDKRLAAVAEELDISARV